MVKIKQFFFCFFLLFFFLFLFPSFLLFFLSSVRPNYLGPNPFYLFYLLLLFPYLGFSLLSQRGAHVELLPSNFPSFFFSFSFFFVLFLLSCTLFAVIRSFWCWAKSQTQSWWSAVVPRDLRQHIFQRDRCFGLRFQLPLRCDCRNDLARVFLGAALFRGGEVGIVMVKGGRSVGRSVDTLIRPGDGCREFSL